jgi:hypothetical protein
MGKVLPWLEQKRVRLFQYFDEKKPICSPSTDFWIIISVIQPLVERIEKTFEYLQGRNTLVSEQRQELSNLSQNVTERMKIGGRGSEKL